MAIIPFFLAAYGGHVAAEALTDLRARRSAKTKFWGMFAIGVLLATMYQYRTQKADGEKQKRADAAQETARITETEFEAGERANAELTQSLQRSLEKALTHPQSQEQRIALLQLRDDISKELAEKLKPADTSTDKTLQNSLVPGTDSPLGTKPCREDDLADCADRELVEWGTELLTKTRAISDAYIAAIEVLNKSPNDSNWLERNAQTNEAAADRFRDCCAEDAVKFRKELAVRVGGGFQDTESYDWVQKLLSPVQSDEWKAARENAGYKVNNISYNLRSLSRKLDLKISLAAIHQMH